MGHAEITNETDSRVIIHIDYPDRESDFTNFSGPDGCAPGTLIARTPSGDEVARREQPFCIGETWVIQVDGDSNSN